MKEMVKIYMFFDPVSGDPLHVFHLITTDENREMTREEAQNKVKTHFQFEKILERAAEKEMANWVLKGLDPADEHVKKGDYGRFALKKNKLRKRTDEEMDLFRTSALIKKAILFQARRGLEAELTKPVKNQDRISVLKSKIEVLKKRHKSFFADKSPADFDL